MFPYMFVIAAEILAESIRVNKEFWGINLFEKEFTIPHCAGDTSLYREASEKACLFTLYGFRTKYLH